MSLDSRVHTHHTRMNFGPQLHSTHTCIDVQLIPNLCFGLNILTIKILVILKIQKNILLLFTIDIWSLPHRWMFKIKIAIKINIY